MPDLTQIIAPQKLADIRAAFDTNMMDAALAQSLPSDSPNSQDYVTAIKNALTTNLPADITPGPRSRLSQMDRERVLIAILASRSDRLNLAVHLYYALGIGISVDEILHILLLAGIYSGLPNLANALDLTRDAFNVLVSLSTSQLDPVSVLKTLKQKFDLPPPN